MKSFKEIFYESLDVPVTHLTGLILKNNEAINIVKIVDDYVYYTAPYSKEEGVKKIKRHEVFINTLTDNYEPEQI